MLCLPCYAVLTMLCCAKLCCVTMSCAVPQYAVLFFALSLCVIAMLFLLMSFQVAIGLCVQCFALHMVYSLLNASLSTQARDTRA